MPERAVQLLQHWAQEGWVSQWIAKSNVPKRRALKERMPRDTSVVAIHPAQQDSCFMSLRKDCAASFKPSTIVR